MMARKVLVGAAWSVAARLISRCTDLVTLLVLARLLDPADFGLVAVAMTLVSLLEAVLELPVATALICQPRLDAVDFDTAFTLAALRGLALGALAVALAWPFAHVYGDGRLVGLVAVLALAPMSRGLASPRMIEPVKALNYRPGFTADVTGRAAACVLAIGAAIVWRDHWAIVVSTVTGPAVMTLVSYRLAPHRPRFTLARWPVFRGFFGWSSAAQFVSAINWQFDRLLLGRLVPAAALGQFSMASDLAALPNQSLIAPLLSPTLAAFTHMIGDRVRLQNAYARATAAVLVIGLPMLVGLSLTAEPLVATLLGGKWNSAPPLLQWLALEAIPYLFTMPALPLAVMSGQVRVLFQRNAVELALKIPLVVGGALLFGIAGVVAARIVMAVVIAGVCMRLTRGLIGSSLSRQVFDHWRPILSCLVMTAAVILVRSDLDPAVQAPWMRLAILVATGAATYGLVILALGFRPSQILGLPFFDSGVRTPAE